MASICDASSDSRRPVVAGALIRLGRAVADALRAAWSAPRRVPEGIAGDLLYAFAHNELAALPTLFLLASILAIAGLHWAAPWQVMVWLGVVVLAKSTLLWLCRKYRAEGAPSGPALAVWQRRFALAEALCGATWAGFALVGIAKLGLGSPDDLLSSHLFVFAAYTVLLAVRLALASCVPALFCAGTLPMTVAVMARLLLTQDALSGALAAMACGIQVCCLYLSLRARDNAVETLQLRAEKDVLMAELEAEKVRCDAARRRAEQASAAKSRFLASMSHELRTPLNAILGFSEVMKTQMLGPLENDTYRDYAGSIHDSGTHLLNLINEILDLSRIEADRYEIVESTFRLETLLGECRQLLRLRAQAKQITFDEDFGLALPLLRADERAVRQICLNLLTNALKFTPQRGHITLGVNLDGQGAFVIAIRDNGPGIPADEVPKVMQAFGQGSLAQRCAEGGTGLGLSIVQSLVELHGGRFELITSEGRGTEARVVFPPWRCVALVERRLARAG